MKNRIVGILVVGIAALIGFVIFTFNRALTEIVNTSCEHGETCPMWGSIDFYTNISIGVMVFVVLIGLYLIFFSKEEKLVMKVRTVPSRVEPRKITKEAYQKVIEKLGKEERSVFEKVLEAKGSIFQSQLVSGTGFTKVKVTRILDRLEGAGIIERKRRGMTNIIVLKH